jgi:hypothetical protein
MFQVGATGFEPMTSRTRSKRSFLNYRTLVADLNVTRRCEAQTTPSRCRSAFIDEAERSSAPFAWDEATGEVDSEIWRSRQANSRSP